MWITVEAGGEGIHRRHLTAADRARVSGPGLRAFRNTADLWGLSEKQRIAILGEPARSTYHAWMKKARAGEGIVLPLDTLLRLSGILGIQKALEILFADPHQAVLWLRNPHQSTVFRGAPPLTFITDGAQDGIMTVRRYLDAWRGGHPGQGVAEAMTEPITDEDIVFA